MVVDERAVRLARQRHRVADRLAPRRVVVPLREFGGRRQRRTLRRWGDHHRLAIGAERRLDHAGHDPAGDVRAEVGMAVRGVAGQKVAVDDGHHQVAALGVADVAAIPARLERAGGGAAVAGDGVSVVAGFARQLEPVATRGGAAGRSGADRLGAAIGAAAVASVHVAVVAGLAAFLHIVAAGRPVAGLTRCRAGEAPLHPADLAATVCRQCVAVVALLEAELRSVTAPRDAAGARLRTGPPRLEPAARVAAVSGYRVVIVAGLRAGDHAVAAGDGVLARTAGRRANPVRLGLAIGRATVAARAIAVVAESRREGRAGRSRRGSACSSPARRRTRHPFRG